MDIRKFNIKDLIPSSYNPRKNLTERDPEYQKIKRSIQTFGYVDPIIVNKNFTIIGGHQRFKVLKDLGVDEIDCVVVDLSADQEKALNIALNKISGEWDIEALKNLFLELEMSDFDISLTGFDTPEFRELMGRCEIDVKEDDFNPDNSDGVGNESEPITQKGDIWQLGNHFLICGDATDADHIKMLMGGKQAKLIITDPPYNNDYESDNDLKMKIENNNINDKDFYNFLTKSFENMFAVTEKGAPIYVFHAQMESANFINAFKAAGYKLAECLIWVKNIQVIGRQDYHWRHEPILYGWREGAAHSWFGDRNKSTVFDFTSNFENMKKEELIELIQQIYDATTVFYENKPNSSALHPAMKPLGLVSKMIYNSSQPGDLILDPFGGSGSTLIAAELTGRNCCMMEIDPKYCDVIITRFEALTDKLARRLT